MPKKADKAPLILLGIFAALGLGAIYLATRKRDKPGESTPRGLRNSNPLNLKVPGGDRNPNYVNWKGEIVPSQDLPFSQFKSMFYGWRAALKNLQSYRNLPDPRRTIGEIIQLWDGPSDETNWNYVNYVVNRANEISNDYTYGVGKVLPGFNDQSELETVKIYWPIAVAMAEFENGSDQTATIAGSYSQFVDAIKDVRDA